MLREYCLYSQYYDTTVGLFHVGKGESVWAQAVMAPNYHVAGEN